MIMQIRVTDEQHQKIKDLAEANGFESVSAFVKYVAMNCEVVAKDKNKK